MKNANNLFFVSAGEPKQTPDSDKRMSRFFDSFTVSPVDPFGEAIEPAQPADTKKNAVPAP